MAVSRPLSRLANGNPAAASLLVLAHGSGQGMESPFMTRVATTLADHTAVAGGLRVIRFEFPYMQRIREGGKRLPPDRQPVLLESWRQVIMETREEMPDSRLFIGGKSMGGRIASMVADAEKVDGLICVGYPFHPPGKPEKLRTEHLHRLATPTLICQGERDAFGKREEIAGYALSAKIHFCWMPDGDHGFKPRKRSGETLEQNLDAACRAIAAFIAA